MGCSISDRQRVFILSRESSFAKESAVNDHSDLETEELYIDF